MTGFTDSAAPCRTRRGRLAFVVNVEVFLHRDGRWLLIRRSAREDHAPGLLSGVGGKVEPAGDGDDVLAETARREVAEEVGVDLTGVTLSYVESRAFTTDDGDPVVNVVFAGPLPAEAEPAVASPEEVAGLVWVTLAEAEADATCPPWIRGSLRQASTW
ncbi:NUDIX domain-containing protein [Micromonospora yasonensis]|uniref:NUDIX hydrolase n=1 Tax=Micromonospora yasonensis TaxID=1128667 RepID=UPI00222EBE96|nr:NUDIX domain-containing protein [Micromonospora yasonensis]MCW3842286.1 NUDIX domain-containing protein [Micromonospora yasonensis]